MRNSETALLCEIEGFLEVSGLSPTAFGQEVMGDRHLVHRLRSGKSSVTLKTADKIRSFMREWKLKRRPNKRVEARLFA
jgi:hypothetical protein